MVSSELTEYLKTAFEYKNKCDYKQSIDYFYKALAIDNESTEIMKELASLYSKLCRYDRSISFYEQILQKLPDDNTAKYKLAHLLKLTKDYKRAEQIFLELYNSKYNIDETAEELFFILVYNQKYGKIITSYNKYSKELKNSGVLYYVALAHSELGNKNTANEFFKKSFDNNIKNILAGIEIASRLFERGKKEEANQLALKLLKYSEDARIYYLLAEIEYSGNNIDNAIKYYSYAITINPGNAQYHFKLALTFTLKGFFKEAEESFCKAINLDSQNELYNYSLAYMYYITGKYDLAIKINDFILAKNPDNVDSIALKILICAVNDKNRIEAKLIEKLENTPNKSDFLLYAQSVYYSKLNLWKKAADTITEAIKLNKSSDEYNYQLANFNYKMGKIDEAEVISERIIKNNPKYIQAYILLGKINLDNKNHKKAKEFLDIAVELDKNSSESYYLTGCIYYDLENYEKAIEKFKTAVSIAPNTEEYYNKIAQSYFRLKMYNEAYLYYKEAADFNITKAEYRYYMAQCSEKTGNIENAKANYLLMKRLAPTNSEYIKEYAKFMEKLGRQKDAFKILKSLKNNI